MDFALFSLPGLFFFFRWMHIFFGIIWIGLLYYFNFVQGSFFAETDAATKSNAIQKLVPRALWWFRWGAMFTIITGILMLGMLHGLIPGYFSSSRGVLILVGMGIGLLMWFNVWFIIWPNQKVVIANATDTAQGKPANPKAADCGARALIASRTNVLYSIGLLFFMASAVHLPLAVSPDKSLMPLWGVVAVILGLLQANAMVGKKTGPMTTVKGVIHCGLAFAIVMYFIVEFLTK